MQDKNRVFGQSGGGVLSDPDCGLEAIKTGLDDVKKSVGDGKKKVAAAIAAKGVTTAADSTFDTLASNIGKIVTLSSGSADATAGAAQILSGYSAYVKGAKVNGSMPLLGAQTITPGTAAKTIAAGRYLSGLQTIAGDANLVAANIKKGVSIFGIPGTFEGLSNAKSGTLETKSYSLYSTTGRRISKATINLGFKVRVLLVFLNVFSEPNNGKIYTQYCSGCVKIVEEGILIFNYGWLNNSATGSSTAYDAVTLTNDGFTISESGNLIYTNNSADYSRAGYIAIP